MAPNSLKNFLLSCPYLSHFVEAKRQQKKNQLRNYSLIFAKVFAFQTQEKVQQTRKFGLFIYLTATLSSIFPFCITNLHRVDLIHANFPVAKSLFLSTNFRLEFRFLNEFLLVIFTVKWISKLSGIRRDSYGHRRFTQLKKCHYT
jgi:hypothetical protein